MSRRSWSVVAPIILIGAIFGVRNTFWKETKADWKETETDFRRDVKSWTKEVPQITVFVKNRKPKLHFKGGVWDTSDFLSTVDKIHLTRGQSKLPETETWASVLPKEPMIVVSLNDGGSVGASEGFYLSLKEHRGWVDIPSQLAEDDWRGPNWRNRGCELTPQTCKALKKHLFSLQDKNGELTPSR